MRNSREQHVLQKRVEWCVKNKINWMQPTISPAPKNIEKNEIESLEKAMEYYTPFQSKLMLQKKYMGSYCLMYLNKDHSKSYFVSRGGYVIKGIQNKLLEASEEIHKKCLHFGDEWVMMESELMPWRALGENLINFEYVNYGFLHEERLEYLSSSNILKKIEEHKKQKLWDKQDLKSHEKRQYGALKDISFPNLKEYETSIKLYQEQLNLFGNKGNVEFKPFNILKCISKTGNEDFYEYQEEFLVDKKDFIIVGVNDFETAYKFLGTHKTERAEGIMVKPYEQNYINIAPALKVRNNNYLQLIYGVNFDRDFSYYLERRNIKSKLRQSVEDYEIARQLLKIPRDKISSHNKQYINLLYKFFNGEEYAKTFDTRL